MDKMKRIFVTGGAGYIGSHVCKLLVEKGYEILVYDNLSKGHKWAVPKSAKFIKADLADLEILEKSLKEFKPDAVMHFAASLEVEESVFNPQKYFFNNTVNTLNLIRLCMENKINNFVFSSTCAIYGTPKEMPVRESVPLSPESNYGLSKLFVEQILKSYSEAYGFNYVSLRYFNVAGASIDNSIGDSYEPRARLIPILMDVASGKRDKFLLFGTDYNTRDGTCVRDYIHVVDLADAHIKALEFLLKNKKSEFFNLGSGKGVTVREMAESVIRVTKKQINIIEEKRRPGDVEAIWADYSKAKKILGWEPKYSDIDTIIKTAWEWEKKQKDDKRAG